MKKKLNEVIYNIARYTEIAFSMLILAIIIICVIPLVHDITAYPLLEMNKDAFTTFLGNSLTLVVGVEFVKMLCRHTAETLLEVMMFATARQMVVEHLQTWQTLIGVLALGILFAIRKYLLIKDPETNKDKL